MQNLKPPPINFLIHTSIMMPLRLTCAPFISVLTTDPSPHSSSNDCFIFFFLEVIISSSCGLFLLHLPVAASFPVLPFFTISTTTFCFRVQMIMVLLLYNPSLPNRSLYMVQVLVADNLHHPSFLITLLLKCNHLKGKAQPTFSQMGLL